MKGQTVAILGAGPSMSQAVANRVKHLPTIAVNDTIDLAPWAVAHVAADAAWWMERPQALAGSRERFTLQSEPAFEGVQVVSDPLVPVRTNSGAVALWLAASRQAARVLLLGFDLVGSHYFGEHRHPLANTSPHRFEVFKRQFAELQGFLRTQGTMVINCTAGSHLRCFPMGSVEDYA